MATINFSVPEAVKRDCKEGIKARNESAIIVELMRGAIGFEVSLDGLCASF
jgi:hypothetical protein